jgi:hypothetical protein
MIKAGESPAQSASLLSFIVFAWLDPIIYAASKVKHLSWISLPALAPSEHAAALVAESKVRLDPFAGAPENTNIFWALCILFRKSLVIQSGLLILNVRNIRGVFVERFSLIESFMDRHLLMSLPLLVPIASSPTWRAEVRGKWSSHGYGSPGLPLAQSSRPLATSTTSIASYVAGRRHLADDYVMLKDCTTVSEPCPPRDNPHFFGL